MKKIIGGVVVSIAPPCGEEPFCPEPQRDNHSEFSKALGGLYEHLILEARHASGRASEWTACVLDKWAASAHSMATRLSL